MKKAGLVILLGLVMSLQGCFISVNSEKGCSGKSNKEKQTAVKATLDAMNSLQSQEAKIEALGSLARTPMAESDYIAVVNAIKEIKDEKAKEELLIDAINSRREYKENEKKPKKGCSN